jgi:hypothetical protein
MSYYHLQYFSIQKLKTKSTKEFFGIEPIYSAIIISIKFLKSSSKMFIESFSGIVS